MFPTKEERVPKLRFADFEGEWELCKLIGILDIIKGTQKASLSYQLIKIIVPLILCITEE